MAITLQMVEDLNRRSASLNSKRQQQIGMYEASRQAYEKAVMGYKAKYGVDIDDTNIQQEYNAVKTQLESDYNNLNSQIVKIETGEYKNDIAPVAQVQKPQQVQVGTVQGQVDSLTSKNVGASMETVNPPTQGTRGAFVITPDMLEVKATPVEVPKELRGGDDEDIDTSTSPVPETMVKFDLGGVTAPTPSVNTGFAQFVGGNSQPTTPTTHGSGTAQPKVTIDTDGDDDDDDEVVTVSGWGSTANTDVGVKTGGIDINAHFPNILGK